ncbi:MAG: hypothetical protein ACE5I1_03130 [bacterium]
MQRFSYRTRFILAAVVAIILTAVSPDRSKSADSTVSVINEFIEHGFSGHTIDTRDEILQYYGTPNRTETRYIRNTHYPTIVDRVHTFYYDGLAIKLYEASLPGREFVVAIFLYGNQYQLIGGLHIGVTSAQIIETLGMPTVVTDKLMIYDEMQSGEGRVCFRLDGEVVKDIFWEYYFD